MLSRSERLVTLLILVCVAVTTLYPLAVLVSTALEPLSAGGSGISFNHPLSFAAFGYAWQTGSFSSYMLNTVIVTVSVVVVSSVVAVMSGYAVALIRPPGARIVLYVAILGFILPVEALIVPWYYQLLPLGLVNTYWAMILPQVAQSVAFGTFWMYTVFRSLPRSLSESAIIDGASKWTLLWRILPPNPAPRVRKKAAPLSLRACDCFP